MYEEYLEKVREECLIRNRFSRTADTYVHNICHFMKWTGNKPMVELTLQDARNFILEKRRSGAKASTCNFYNSSICFLYKHVLHIPWDQDTVPRMKLDAANQWKDKGKKFFFPVKVMSAVFRKYYLRELKQLWEEGKLEYHGAAEHLKNNYEFKALLDDLYGKPWIVYTKEAFNGANSVIRYLGRYTHRIAISNRRIVSMTDETVTYLVKDYKNGGRYIQQTIKGTEFLRMFLMHVLPKGFVRIRHYGLLSCRNKREKIDHCRKLLHCIQYQSKLRGKSCAEKMLILYRKDICKCESCGGRLLTQTVRGCYMLS